MPQKGFQNSPGQPYRRTTGKPQAYDEKARLGAIADGDGEYLPSETFDVGPIPGPDQNGNGPMQKPSYPAAPKLNISKPRSGFGGPLE